jgi:hypothetical protein
MKNIQIKLVIEVLDKTLTRSKSVRLNLQIIKIKKTLTSILEDLAEVIKPTDRFQEFESKRIELCKKHATKDENGEPHVENNVFLGLTNNSGFDSDVKLIMEEYKETITEYNKKQDEFKAILLEDIKLDDIPKISNIPDDIINGIDLELIVDLIE